MNIVFIGMPGSGKSTVGNAFADILSNFSFIDTDKVIESKNGKPLQHVVDELGHERFIAHEASVVQHVARRATNTVISPGGSVIYCEETMRVLRDTCTAVVFLRVSEAVLLKRIGETPRGISANGKSFSELYAERQPLYFRHSTLTVDGEKSVDDIVRFVLARVRMRESAT